MKILKKINETVQRENFVQTFKHCLLIVSLLFSITLLSGCEAPSCENTIELACSEMEVTVTPNSCTVIDDPCGNNWYPGKIFNHINTVKSQREDFKAIVLNTYDAAYTNREGQITKRELCYQSDIIPNTPYISNYEYQYFIPTNDESYCTFYKASNKLTLFVESKPPIAKAGPDQFVALNNTVALDGSESHSTDRDTALLNYNWRFLSKPSNSTAAFSENNVSNPSFIADIVGTYKIELVVNDGSKNSDHDIVIIETSSRFSDLAIMKFESSSIARLGSPINYSLEITNNGPDEATSTLLRINLPDQNKTSYSISDINTSQGAACSVFSDYFTCELGVIPKSSQALTANFVLNPISSTVNSIISTAIVSTQSDETKDPYQGNNSIDLQQTLFPSDYVNLEISITDIPDPVQANSTGAFNIGVKNTGTKKATNVTVDYFLPVLSSLDPSVIHVTPGLKGSCEVLDLKIQCNVGDMEADETALINIILLFTYDFPNYYDRWNKTLISRASVYADNATHPMPNSYTNEETLLIVNGNTSDVLVRFLDSPSPIFRAEPFSYTIEVENNGNSHTGISLKNVLPILPSGKPIRIIDIKSEPSGNCMFNETYIDCSWSNIFATKPTLTVIASATESTAPSFPALLNSAKIKTRPFDDTYSRNNEAFTEIVVLPESTSNIFPTARDDAYSINEDNPLIISTPGILENDFDPERKALTAVKVDFDEQNGKLTFYNDGSFSYIPDPDFNGKDTFTYQAFDGTDTGNIATVEITVNPVNDAPVAYDDNYTVLQGTTLIVNNINAGILNQGTADSDIDSNNLTVNLKADANQGDLILNQDGTFEYSPFPSFYGEDRFTYVATDGLLESNIVTVTIQVDIDNETPIANDNNYSVDEDLLLNVLPENGLLTNDTDSDGDTLTIVSYDQPANGQVDVNLQDGSFTYSPFNDFNGTDSFTYYITDTYHDSTPATVTITVNPLNDAPIANDDPPAGIPYVTIEDVELVISDLAQGLLFNDSDIDSNQLTVVRYNQPNNGRVNIAANGTFTYQPENNFNGTDSFTYFANDGETDSSTAATVTIIISPDNDAPIVNNKSYSVVENNILNIAAPGVLVNITDIENDPLTAEVVTNINPSTGILTFFSDGSFSYEPSLDFEGLTTFTYVAYDGTDISTVPGTVSITVIRANNNPPIANNDNGLVVDEDGSLNINVLSNDTDADDDTLTSVLDSPPSNGTVIPELDGTFTYIPGPNFNGQDSFTYFANDSFTNSVSSAVVSINVSPLNDAPEAIINMTNIPPVYVNDLLQLDASASFDVDGDNLTYQWIMISQPNGSNATLSDAAIINPTLSPDYSGFYTLELQVNDGFITSTSPRFTIEVDLCRPEANVITWVSPNGGLWSDTNNWDPNRLPGPTDDVCIGVAADITVNHSTGIDTINSLLSEEAIIISGGSLDINNTSQVNNTFEISAGTLGGSGIITIEGLLNWSGGSMQGLGETVANGGMLINGSTQKQLFRTLSNANNGTAIFDASNPPFTTGPIVLYGPLASNDSYNGAVINNLTGATFDIRTDSDLRWQNGEAPIFNNEGMLQKSAGTGTTIIGASVNNDGVINVSNGTLSLNGGDASSSGTFTAQANATIAFGRGNHVLETSANVNGNSAQFTGGTTTLLGDYAVTTGTTITSGTVNFNGSVSSMGNVQITESSGIANVSANVNNNGIVTAISYNQTAGTLTGNSEVRINGLLTWSGGSMQGLGETVANGGMLINGSTQKQLFRTLSNANNGTAIFDASNPPFTTGPIVLYGPLASNSSYNGAVINNLVGATFDIRTDSDLRWQNGETPIFNNAGTVQKSAGTGTTIVGATMENSGSIATQSGQISFADDFNSFGASSNIDVDIAGLTAGLEYDQYIVSGAVTFAGDLVISLTNGFIPSIDDSFVIFTYASRIDVFDNVNLPTLPSGNWDITYGANELTLTVVP